MSELARLANDLRLGWAIDQLTLAQARYLEKSCARLWAWRGDLLHPGLSAEERDDLLEVVLFRAGLGQRLISSPEIALRGSPGFVG